MEHNLSEFELSTTICQLYFHNSHREASSQCVIHHYGAMGFTLHEVNVRPLPLHRFNVIYNANKTIKIVIVLIILETALFSILLYWYITQLAAVYNSLRILYKMFEIQWPSQISHVSQVKLFKENFYKYHGMFGFSQYCREDTAAPFNTFPLLLPPTVGISHH